MYIQRQACFLWRTSLTTSGPNENVLSDEMALHDVAVNPIGPPAGVDAMNFLSKPVRNLPARIEGR